MKNNTNKIWQALAFISRVIIGVLFVFSGYVKAVDPLGFKYKIIEYLESLGFGFLTPLALLIAILVIAAELAMGLCLLARIRMNIVAWGVLLFMIFFTVLTFYIAVAGDVVKDCGCFGDAIILSNWATFWKNVIAMIFVLIIFLWRKNYAPVAKPLTEWIILIVIYAASASISLYCLKNLPIIDFMAYKVGTNIPQAMEFPEDAELDQYKTIYHYSKDGVTKEFDETNYPWQDSTWTFVDSKSELVKKGYEPPIHDFVITTQDDIDITDSILYGEQYVLIMTSQKLEEASTKNIDKINEIANYCLASESCNFFAYTASGEEVIDNFIAKNNAQYTFCGGDETTIKSIVRSNPGLILIHNGNVVAKWSHGNTPSIAKLEEIMTTDYNTIVEKTKAKEKRTTIILAIIALVAILPLNFIRKRD